MDQLHQVYQEDPKPSVVRDLPLSTQASTVMNRRSAILAVVLLVVFVLVSVSVFFGLPLLQSSSLVSSIDTPVISPATMPPLAVQPSAQPTLVPTTVPSSTSLPSTKIPIPTPTTTQQPTIVLKPQPILFDPNAGITQTEIIDLPSRANTSEPAYIPGQGFTPDAQRVLDIASLQLSLEKYRAAKGRYPSSLDDLFPTFAPIKGGQTLSAPPVDPETHQPYTYIVLNDGKDYFISATLKNGSQYTGVKRDTP